MLVLSRKKQQRVVIDGQITVTILECSPQRVRLGIVAPEGVKIARQELVINHGPHAAQRTLS